MKKINEFYVMAFIVLLAFGLRFWSVAQHESYEGDEGVLVPATFSYFDSGNFSPDSWEHPPLKYFLLSASMRIFGNNAYGWRLKNVLLGSLTIAGLMLLCKELFLDKRIALSAALLLVFDPVHLFYSRTVYGEIPSTFFFLLACYFTVLYLNGKLSSPLPAGIFLGLSVASKWYFGVPLLAVFLYTLVHQISKQGFRWAAFLHLVSIYLILPLCVYIAFFYPWFQRGYLFPELLQNQIDAYFFLQDQPVERFTNPFFRSTPSSPWVWFIRPLIVGIEVTGSNAWGQFLMFMNNPPFWLLTIPAAFYSSYRVWKDRNHRLSFVIMLFLSLYLQFAIVDRPLFLYSAVVVLPFVYILVAYFLLSVLAVLSQGKQWPYRALLVATCLWGLYLYPLITNRNVPVALYKPLFLLGTVVLQ